MKASYTSPPNNVHGGVTFQIEAGSMEDMVSKVGMLQAVFDFSPPPCDFCQAESGFRYRHKMAGEKRHSFYNIVCTCGAEIRLHVYDKGGVGFYITKEENGSYWTKYERGGGQQRQQAQHVSQDYTQQQEPQDELDIPF